MPTINETGHNKNIANFADLIAFCTGYGTKYVPSKAIYKLTALNSKLLLCQTKLNEVNIDNTNFNNQVNTRINLFKNYKPTATRIVNALSVTDATAETIKNAKTINRKIQGIRAGTIVLPSDPNQPTPKTISVSQQSYDSKIEQLNELIAVIKSEASYNPNEIDLKVATLESYKVALENINGSVSTSYVKVSNSRISRDKEMYNATTGLYDIAQGVKDYTKSAFGSNSVEYKQISKIKFTKPR
jgi:hypothetical protein